MTNLKLQRLPMIQQGQTVKLQADRFAVNGQELSFMEDLNFVSAWNEVLLETEPYARDVNLSSIFWRAHVAFSLFVNSARAKAAYVECGTHLGIISRFIFKMTKHESYPKYCFDTWNGVPSTQFSDDEPLAKWHNENNYKEDTFDVIKTLTEDYCDVHLVRGIVPDTFDKTHEKINPTFLHIDMNIEYPERKALEFFVPQMEKGSVVLLDDYGFQKHNKQRLMADKFFQTLGKIPTQLPTGQAFVIL